MNPDSPYIIPLGISAATFMHGRRQSGMLVKVNRATFLIDCGEGTQITLSEIGQPLIKIDAVFISHLHGDHFLGFTGLIGSMSLQGRVEPLYVFAPTGLEAVVKAILALSETILNFELKFQTLSSMESEEIYIHEEVRVSTLPLVHRVYCNGFLFTFPEHSRFGHPTLSLSDFPREALMALKAGNTYTNEQGEVFNPKDFKKITRPQLRFAYCSDTAYHPPLVPLLQEVDLLYHEATFLSDKQERAAQTMHSTAQQAAEIAKAAQVKHLLMGHFSGRYKDLSLFEKEAKEVFPSSAIAQELEKVYI